MDNEQILSKLTEVFRSVFDDDTIVLTADTSSDDIEEWDSLNQIRIILACESSFNLKLNARHINTLSNVGEMVDFLSTSLNSR